MAAGKRTLEIIIAGNASGAEKAFAAINAGAGGMSRAIGIAAGATAAGFAAVAGGAGFAVREAAGFQESMREVFTLLPGITADAMREMEGEVKAFSNEFGTLPNEVVPALYQSLSAGVPQDNVFEFLEVAQKAAKGGVTDLTTAVDGISTVVNAYGSDVITASEASDFMFTAVRLGKTNMEELAGSMSNVIPAASQFGVGMDEVSAAIAVMTAQGTPTAQATTQIRSALVDLGSEGKTAFKAFEDAAGQTFPQFMAEGGSLGDAMDILQTHADDTGVTMLDLFGRIEGGMGALAIGSDAFDDASAAMANSAGATQTAFDIMDQGLNATLDRLKARFVTTAITVGEYLLPHVERFFGYVDAVAVPAIGRLINVFQADGLSGVLTVAGDKFAELWPSISSALGGIATNVVDWVIDTAPVVADQLVAWGDAFVGWIGPQIPPAIEELGKLLGAVADWTLDVGLPTLVTNVAAWGESFIGWVIPTIPPLLSALGNVLLDVGGWIVTTAAPKLLGYLAEWSVAFAGWAITDLTPKLLTALGTALIDLGGWIVNTAAPKLLGYLGEWTGKFTEWATGIPAKIGEGMANLGSTIWGGIRDAWDYVKERVSTLGSIGLPGINVPGVGSIGGFLDGINPFHSGGTFAPNRGGNAGLALLRRGERVSTPSNAMGAVGGAGLMQTVNVLLDTQTLATALVRHSRNTGAIDIRTA